MKNGFRYYKWDLLLNVSQIICVQSLFYVGLCFFINLTSYFVNDIVSLDLIFDSQRLTFKTKQGSYVAALFIVNALLVSLALWRFVGRSRLCLDFSVTVYSYHALLCWWWLGRLPTSAAWWLVQLLSAGISCVCAELLCVRSELALVPVTIATANSL